ncbi:hypothetical protein CQ10_26225 [Bradyrhizobium valentinum]|nr:hypothetical protein CQ10_26225 [Bradyrhizobium valentinum]
MWRRLEGEFAKAPVDLLVLPELAGVDNFWASPVFSEDVWRQAVAAHALISDQLKHLAARRIVGTRAVEDDTRRWNETFLFKPETALRAADQRLGFRSKRAVGKQPGSTAVRKMYFLCVTASCALLNWCVPNLW